MAYSTINKSSEHFNTKLYTGNGSAGNAVTGVGFAPNMVWIKERSSTSSHTISDTVRGAGKRVNPDLTNAEETLANLMTSFDSDGFTNGADNGVNESGQTYASWNWKANGAGSANTDGSISSTVSANTTSGFSIVKYTGTGADMTVGHGLNAVPKMIIVKALDTGTDPWWVYHASLGNSAKLRLNGTQASQTGADYIWNQTTPTSSVFSLDGTNNGSNANGNDFIAYCFADVQGYSKFSSYTGNGSTDGSFIYTGMKPAFVLIKNSSATADWCLRDNKRSTINVTQHTLFPNTNDSESYGGTSYDIDFLSNGFKIRSTSSRFNTSSNNYIYMAFAEAPLVGTNNVPCTAR